MAYNDLYLEYTLGGSTRSIYLGYVTSITETFSKTVSAFPLVSMSQDNTFGLENGNGQSYQIQFKHVADTMVYAYDGNLSPAEWYDKLTQFVDRWQTRSNGFRLVYRPSPQINEINPYVQNIDVNGYVRSLQRTFKAGNLTEIDCTLRFDVGTMYVRNKYLVPMGWELTSL